MIALSIGIVFALLITIGIPIGAAYWLYKKLGLPWRVITYGALGYLIVQALVSFVFIGFHALAQNGQWSLSDEGLLFLHLTLSIIFLALFGVLVRWGAMKYFKEYFTDDRAALGLGVGYGGMQSIFVLGLPLLNTFVTMLANLNINPETSTRYPEVIAQVEELWQVPAYVPLVGAIEQVAALVMNITVTVLIFQAVKRTRFYWLGAAFGLELLVNGLIAGLSEAGLQYGWVIVIGVIMMIGNLYLLYRLSAHKIVYLKRNQVSEWDDSE